MGFLPAGRLRFYSWFDIISDYYILCVIQSGLSRICGAVCKRKNILKCSGELWYNKYMYTETAKLTFYIPYSQSLKDKRQVCRSITDKVRQRFNVSVAEVDTQDVHQTLTIGAAVVSGESSHARKSLDAVIRFMEENADAELMKVE